MDSTQARTVWQRYWPVDLLAVVVVVLVLIFGGLLAQRTTDAKQLARTLSVQSERQRQAICAILANIPGHIPPEIRHARTVFARPGHPDDCKPAVTPHPKASPASSPSPSPVPTRTVFVAPSNGGGASESPRPAPRPSHTPTPTATPTPHPSPSQSPSPSPTCGVIRHILHRC